MIAPPAIYFAFPLSNAKTHPALLHLCPFRPPDAWQGVIPCPPIRPRMLVKGLQIAPPFPEAGSFPDVSKIISPRFAPFSFSPLLSRRPFFDFMVVPILPPQSAPAALSRFLPFVLHRGCPLPCAGYSPWTLFPHAARSVGGLPLAGHSSCDSSSFFKGSFAFFFFFSFRSAQMVPPLNFCAPMPPSSFPLFFLTLSTCNICLCA